MEKEIITLNNNIYYTLPKEFILVPHEEYNNLQIYPKVGELERIIGLLNDLIENTDNKSLFVYGWTYGGFVPIGCSKVYNNVYVYTDEDTLKDKLKEKELYSNIHFNIIPDSIQPEVIYIENIENIKINRVAIQNATNSYILSRKCNDIVFSSNKYIYFPLYNTDLILYIPIHKFHQFYSEFRYYFDDNKNFKYDNLINLCIMVKNAGELFEKVLTENLPYIDRWTILDTGSTDGTQDLVRKILKDKKGILYEEPFINFRESRNRCLDLAGKTCKYNIMLDDTYVIKNDLRDFLNIVRGDQFASSYSLLIKSDDVEYYSNRITMSERNLRYIYTIHEVIQIENNETTVVIPKNAAYIDDYRADYMEKRTFDRKKYDLDLLFEMVKEDPTNPRHYYYLAQTYNLLNDYENSALWFYKRATTELKGHVQEVFDSWFELGRLYDFKLNKPWDECKNAYEEAYKIDSRRPEPFYFIGIHYYLKGDKTTAFDYFKRAFQIGYPIHAQFSLKPTLSFHFLPKFLTQLCYEFNDWELGLASSQRFLENNSPDADSYKIIYDWNRIFTLLNTAPKNKPILLPNKLSDKPVIVFVADGGWGPWTGSDILTKGVGGSETYIIEIARWIQATNRYNCVVFCNCEKSEVFEGVQYLHLSAYSEYIHNNRVDTAIISRFSEYIPLTINGHVDKIYLVLHDLEPSGLLIPMNYKIKKILCLTHWHQIYFENIFPMLKDKTDYFYYGVDTSRFKPGNKIKNSFIYSSFPNRGLLPLLQMWPKIKNKIPDATLNVYSDINGKWVNDVSKEHMEEIRRILENGIDGVTVHGWVSKDSLAAAWSKADVWLYPCIFQETFCLTALEAAASKTLAIGTPLAALNETIGNRGLLIPGNPFDSEWQDNTVSIIIDILADNNKKQELIQKNYEWATNMTWKQRGEDFIKRYIDTNDLNYGGLLN
jgi:hypothetical protein